MKTPTSYLVCGVLSPIVYVAGDVVAGILSEGYSLRDQTISELNAIGSPVRPLTIVLGLLVYVLLTAFAVGAWRAGASRRGLRVAGGLLAAMGLISLWAVPFASMQMRGVPQGPLHIAEGMVAVLLFITAMGFAAGSLGRRFRLYSIATILVLLVFGGWAGLDGPEIAAGLATPWAGVKERISAYSYQLWILVFALTLFRQRSTTAPGHS